MKLCSTFWTIAQFLVVLFYKMYVLNCYLIWVHRNISACLYFFDIQQMVDAWLILHTKKCFREYQNQIKIMSWLLHQCLSASCLASKFFSLRNLMCASMSFFWQNLCWQMQQSWSKWSYVLLSGCGIQKSTWRKSRTRYYLFQSVPT